MNDPIYPPGRESVHASKRSDERAGATQGAFNQSSAGERVTIPTVEGPRNVTTYAVVIGQDPDNAGHVLVRTERAVMGEHVHSLPAEDVSLAPTGPGDVIAEFRDRADAMPDQAADALHSALDYVTDYLVNYGSAYTAEYLFGLARSEAIPAVRDALRDLADDFARRYRA